MTGELKIQIYKLGHTEPRTVVKIPLATLRIAEKLLPDPARWAFEEEGIDWREVVRLIQEEEVTGTLVEVEKRGQRIVVSVERPGAEPAA